MGLTQDEIKAITAKVYSGEYEYERDRPYFEEMAGKPLPSWSELTKEQQEHIRAEQLRYARELKTFGDSLRTGQD